MSSGEESESRSAPPSIAKKSEKAGKNGKKLEELVDDADFSSNDEDLRELETYKELKVAGKTQFSDIDSSKIELWLIKAPLGLDISELNGMKLALEEVPFSDGSIGRFERDKKSFFLSQEPIADVKNTVNIFPNSAENRLEFGKPFSQHLKINEVVLSSKVGDSALPQQQQVPTKKRPELFVRFAPPGASLPKQIKLQMKSEVETGWRSSDFVPYATPELKEQVLRFQNEYAKSTSRSKEPKELRKPSKEELKIDSGKKKRKRESSVSEEEEDRKKKKHKK